MPRITPLTAIALFACMFLAACGGAAPPGVPLLDKCMTKEGFAEFSGTCLGGNAHGLGTATYDDSYLKTVTAHFVGGVPQGETVVEYWDGGSYRGGLKDGENHGFGIDMETWGEGYEGGWDSGFRDGEGVYIEESGRRIPGVWDRGRLLGAWYDDASTSCKVWWSPQNDPTGTLVWDGACENGLAEGKGTIFWTNDMPANRFPSDVTFTGTLVAGKLEGPGVWNEIDRATNLVKRETQTGFWSDGQRTGEGRDVHETEFLDNSFAAASITYSGGYFGGQYSGMGTRIQSKTLTDNRGSEATTESGRFLEGTLREGIMVRDWVRASSFNSRTFSEGRFQSRQYLGWGTVIEIRTSDEGEIVSIAEYDNAIADGGTGLIKYGNGDVFVGRFEYSSGPSEGRCILSSGDFGGPCKVTRIEHSDWHWETCLAPLDDQSQCLIMLGEFFS